jgi:hypothetical protein
MTLKTRNILTIMPSAVMMLLLVGMSTVAKGENGFCEDFSGSVLDPAWTVTNTYPGHGYYSLTGHSLRYYLQPWSQWWQDTPFASDYYPCMRLSRSFSGTNWTFETKINYYMPWANGRNLVMLVCFGSIYNSIAFNRWADQGGGGASADEMAWMSTIDGTSQFGTLPITNTSYDTYYFRIVREDKELTLLWSSDGQNWLSVYNTQMSDQTAGLSQYVFLGGQSWANSAGSYAEYDYIYVEPSNAIPVAEAGPNQTVEATSPDGAKLTLNGSASTDADSTPGTNDDIAYFDWYEGFTPIGSGEIIHCTFGLGTHYITLVVTDSAGATSRDDMIVTIEDTTAPTINSISANPNVLWPANHNMVAVTVTVDFEDICDPLPVCTIVDVTCNESVNGRGDGNTQPDWEITGDLTVKLRAERTGSGSGRVYTIHVECVDASGNIATATVDITVPHDQGKKK